MCPAVSDIYQEVGITDVIIICTDGFVNANAIILTMASALLKSLLTEQQCYCENQIIIWEYPKCIVQYMIQLFQTGEIEIISKADFDVLSNLLIELQIKNIEATEIKCTGADDINSFIDNFVNEEIIGYSVEAEKSKIEKQIIFECPICQSQFISVHYLQLHSNLEHFRKCLICNSKIGGKILAHFKTHVNRTIAETALRKLDLHECELCLKQFTVFSSLQRHYRTSHPQDTNLCYSCANVYLRKTENGHECSRKCSKCGENLKRNINHFPLCHWNKDTTMSCVLCGKIFYKKYSLLCHLQRYL